MNLLLDTNIVIDYLGKKQPFFDNAKSIIAMGFFGDAQLWVPAQSIKDAFYVLSHYVDTDRIQQAIAKLLEVVNLVDLTSEDITNAVRLQWHDLEDCLVSISANKVNADYLVTRDLKGFDRSMVPTITPGDLLSRILDDQGIEYDIVRFDKPDDPVD